MWNFAVLAVLMSVAGVYAVKNAQSLDGAQDGLATATAAEMGIYRGAVIAYFSDHDQLATSVDDDTLKSGGYLPGWSSMSQPRTQLAWRNYRDAGGVIYVYTNTLPTRNLSAELVQLARNSMLFGVYRSGSPNLQSPVYGDTGIPLAALAGMSVPDGAPVWIAMKK